MVKKMAVIAILLVMVTYLFNFGTLKIEAAPMVLSSNPSATFDGTTSYEDYSGSLNAGYRNGLLPAYSITMGSNSNFSENGWMNPAGIVEGAIEWQVNIAAMDANDYSIPLPLEGLKFYDALEAGRVTP